MSWTTTADYNHNSHLNNNHYNQLNNFNFSTGSSTPNSTTSSANFNQKHLLQELNSKLSNSGVVGANSQQNLQYSAPSTVSSVSSESISDFKPPLTSKKSNMGTQIDNYFANEDNSNVSSNFWNFNNPQDLNQLNQKNPLHYHDESLNLGKNTIEEENFLQNQLHNNDVWSNNNYQIQPNNHLNTSNSSLNHSNSDQSLFELMKIPGLAHSSAGNNQISIPTPVNNTQFNNTINNNNNNTPNGLSYTASTTPLPSTPLSSKSPEQMGLSQFQQAAHQASSQQQGPLAPQQPTTAQTQAQGSSFGSAQVQQQIQQLQQLQQQPGVDLINNTQVMMQNYQQQQVYLEQLQQQHQQLMQNPLFIQQQAQLVSQQLQQLQLQLQIQKQQIESNNYQLNNLQQTSSKDSISALTEENLIKLQNTPKDINGALGGEKANSTSSQGGLDKQANVNTELYKTELCSTFNKTGSCPYGNKCQFAHGENELKIVNRGSKYRSKPCANWSKTGSCRYGNRCCFKHGE